MRNGASGRGLAFRLSLYLAICLVLVFTAYMYFNYDMFEKAIVEGIVEKNSLRLSSTVDQINVVLSLTRQTAIAFARTLEVANLSRDETVELLKDLVLNDESTHCAGVSLDPALFKKRLMLLVSRAGKSGDKVEIFTSEHDYTGEPWYLKSLEDKDGFWTEPYFNKLLDDYFMTFDIPFYKKVDGIRTPGGVVSIDISMEWFMKFLSNIRESKLEYMFVMTPDHAVFSNFNNKPDEEYSMFNISDKLDERQKRLIKEISSENQGYKIVKSGKLGGESYVFYINVNKSGWYIGVVIPAHDLFHSLNEITLKVLLIILEGSLITLLIIVFLVRRGISPLRTLVQAAETIGEGDLKKSVPAINTKDEIGMLSRSFEGMRVSLINYIENLKETTSAKEKIEQELSIARNIQLSLLSDPSLSRGEFSLYSALFAAREVGGDMYDYFFMDDTHLCLAVGDVSGKGVPAALFMAVTKTLLRAKANLSSSPGEILEAMNKELCRDNKESMFVTFFIAILDISTGETLFSNAGHNAPAICIREEGFRFMDIHVNVALGIDPSEKYKTMRIELTPGTMMFLYTDGVTEAFDKNGQLYSEEKLLERLTDFKNDSTEAIVGKLKTDLYKHMEGVPQSDDITMLMLRYMGRALT